MSRLEEFNAIVNATKAFNDGGPDDGQIVLHIVTPAQEPVPTVYVGKSGKVS